MLSEAHIACFSLTLDKTKGRKTLGAASEGGCFKGLVKHLKARVMR